MEPASAEVQVGTVLGGTYEITGLIGKGGMGAVWAARHTRLPKRVAVKVLLTQVAASSEAFVRFRREAEVASRLGHPNIVEVIDFDVLPGGTPYLVLELLEGESLAACLKRGPLPVDAALAIARQIASALAAAHREGVVHRDLKPENVFLLKREQDGAVVDHVKVLDFGISKIQGSQTIRTHESMILGTPQYMAPEQATGRHAEVDGRTDQFALGAMLYEMLSGQAPFVGQTLAEVLFKVVYEEPRPLRELAPHVPETVAQAVAKALAKKLDDRFPDLSSLVKALSGRPLATVEKAAPRAPATTGELAATMPSAEQLRQVTPEAYAATVGSGEQPRPAERSRGRAGVVAGAIAGLVVLAGGVALWQLRGKPETAAVATDAPAALPPDATVAIAEAPPDAAATRSRPDAGRAVATRPPKPKPPKPAAAPDGGAPVVQPSPPPVQPPPVPVPTPPTTQPAAEPKLGALMKDFEDLLKSGKWREAKAAGDELLRRSDLNPKQRQRVTLGLFRYACAQKDISLAHSLMRRAPAALWPRLRKQCAALGLEIENPPALSP